MPDDEERNSDEPPEEPALPGFLGGIVMGHPEEIMKQMQEQHTRQQMQYDAEAHSRLNLIEGFTLEHFKYFESVVSHITQHGEFNSEAAAAYQDGFYTAIMWMKFDICPACGVNHHEELEI